LNYELADDLPVINADPTQVSQVVMNLISNAAEAIGESSGVIGVRTGAIDADLEYLSGTYLGAEVREGSYVYLEVSDTGCGMDEETTAKIFDPFFTTKFSGRGLGLAALLGIVRSHSGTLTVTSTPGQGTTFRVLFPSAVVVGEEEVAPAPRETTPRVGGTVLIVDDEEEIREVTQWMLESAGFSVLTAEDGVAGVAAFQRHQEEINAVLLDLAMPRMGGEEALHRMRQIRSEVPILLVSGFGERELTGRLANEQRTAFIQKPYDRAGLTEKLRALLES
jgi:CheY-like chemotaxis protein